MPFPGYPLVNGHRYSWVSINAVFGNVPIPILGIKSINYSSKLTPGKVRGTAPQVIGRTRGEHDAAGDFEMLRLEWELFKAQLGIGGMGFGETSFPIVVQYAEVVIPVPSPVITDTILGCRITENAASNQEGTDPSMVKCTLDVLDVLWNGASIALPDKVAF